jgi:hypothetical protein
MHHHDQEASEDFFDCLKGKNPQPFGLAQYRGSAAVVP